MNWALLILSLPTETAALRMRVWRTLKTVGAAVLRDGVYLLPDLPVCRETLESIAADVNRAAGLALVLDVAEPQAADFNALFQRDADYAALLDEIAALSQRLAADTASDAQKQARKLRRQFDQLTAVDYFPGAAQRQTEQALAALTLGIARILTPDEPQAAVAELVRLDANAYQRKTWATRRRPWVDRLACAWLIQRFIDPLAKFAWLETPDECPAEAVGFDFDGAAFSHVGEWVSYEVLMHSFGIEQPALRRIAAVVHFLDVGGIQPAEAAGVAGVLNGLRAGTVDDDELLRLAGYVFDGLYANYQA